MASPSPLPSGAPRLPTLPPGRETRAFPRDRTPIAAEGLKVKRAIRRPPARVRGLRGLYESLHKYSASE